MSNDSQFRTTTCSICQQAISRAGAAYTAHMRAHVRRNEATEHKRGDHLMFIPIRGHGKFIEDQPYAKLGEEPLPGQPKDVWELPDIAKEMPDLSPSSYFITSGEAVKKAEKLVTDAYAIAVKARSFRDKLLKARGNNKYLETARENSRLLVKIKNPRKHNDVDSEITE